jgi:hypothetical protein
MTTLPPTPTSAFFPCQPARIERSRQGRDALSEGLTIAQIPVTIRDKVRVGL